MNERIYIAGPISKGDREWNVYQSWLAQKQLILEGFAPFNPMPTCCLPFAWEEQFSHDLWMDTCYPWLIVSQGLYRLPGESVGADMEEEFARENDIPVFTNMEDLIKHFRSPPCNDELFS